MVNVAPDAPVTSLKGVGPAFATKLARIGIETIMDLIVHLPFRYEDRTKISAIGSCRPGDTVVIEGEVKGCDVTFGRRRSLLALLQDGTGTIGLRFYHFSKAQQNNLTNAGRIRCFGEVRRGASGPEIYHPEYIKTTGDKLPDALTPVYPVTEGISQQKLRTIAQLALARVGQLPDYVVTETVDLVEALNYVHQPPPDANVDQLEQFVHPMQQRLIREELLAHQVSVHLIREEAARWSAPPIKPSSRLTRQLLDQLPYSLTGAQQRVVQEISEDISRNIPTLRLVQGDVGSGKTVVAAMAIVQAIEAGYQAALMAPTEILAEQHFLGLSVLLEPLGVKMAWLSGKVKGKQRTSELANIASGDAQLVIGTHALFQDEVTFQQLGLAIVDEQHRFGVHQRMALRDKGAVGNVLPHQLVMTATPIPRTLTMSLYATMDCSVIDELPAGRKPITTTVVSNGRRGEIIERVKSACEAGAQAYWVCTLIEESEVLQAQDAEATAQFLHEALTGLKVGLVHGRMKSADKVRVMAEFKRGEIHLLVATTVIEVGVDVPNASLMVVENPERLGLTQLHQLRGRVGRGQAQSYCVLMYQTPLGETSKRRLEVMRSSNDGFYIAEQDLMIRGPGDILGSRQSGMMSFKIADLRRDVEFLETVGAGAAELLARDREAALGLVNRWLKSPSDYGQI